MFKETSQIFGIKSGRKTFQLFTSLPSRSLTKVFTVLFSQTNATVPFAAGDSRSVPCQVPCPERGLRSISAEGAAPGALLTATGRPCSGPSAASRRGAGAGGGAGGCRCLPARLALAWIQRWCRAKVCWRSSSRRSGDTASYRASQVLWCRRHSSMRRRRRSMTALCRGSANSAMGQVGSTMGRGRCGPGPGRASLAAGTAGFAPRRRAAALRPRHGPASCEGGVGSSCGSARPEAGWRSLPTSGLGLAPPPRAHCFPCRRSRHLKIVFRALGRGRDPGRRPWRHG